MAISLTSPMSGDLFKAEVENALDKRGDTMDYGATLTLGKNPEKDMDAVPKKYVDNNIKFYTVTVTPKDNTAVEACTIPNYEPSKHLVFLCENFRHNSEYIDHYGSFLKLSDTFYTYYESSSGGTGRQIKIDDSGKVYIKFYYSSTTTGESLDSVTLRFLVIPVQTIDLKIE